MHPNSTTQHEKIQSTKQRCLLLSLESHLILRKWDFMCFIAEKLRSQEAELTGRVGLRAMHTKPYNSWKASLYDYKNLANSSIVHGTTSSFSFVRQSNDASDTLHVICPQNYHYTVSWMQTSYIYLENMTIEIGVNAWIPTIIAPASSENLKILASDGLILNSFLGGIRGRPPAPWNRFWIKRGQLTFFACNNSRRCWLREKTTTCFDVYDN